MTKTNIEIDKEFDESFTGEITMDYSPDRFDKPIEIRTDIKSFIHSIREADRQDFEKMVENMPLDDLICGYGTYPGKWVKFIRRDDLIALIKG